MSNPTLINPFKVDFHEDALHPESDGEPSPLRKLALAVIARAIYEVENPRGKIVGNKIAGVANNPGLWLHTWDLVEPWCLTAGLSPTRLRRRINELEPRRAETLRRRQIT